MKIDNACQIHTNVNYTFVRKFKLRLIDREHITIFSYWGTNHPAIPTLWMEFWWGCSQPINCLFRYFSRELLRTHSPLRRTCITLKQVATVTWKSLFSHNWSKMHHFRNNLPLISVFLVLTSVKFIPWLSLLIYINRFLF